MKDTITNFTLYRIAVIGDIMLDTFTYGNIERISPEAPIPIVHLQHEKQMLGGAGNVALNLRSLGANVALFGKIASDEAGNQILAECKNNKIDASGILISKSSEYQTTEKRRIIAGNQHFVRIDREMILDLTETEEQKICKQFTAQLSTFDAVIITDYTKGAITQKLAQEIIALARKTSLPIIIDTKPGHETWFKGCTLITPNKKEALSMTKMKDVREAGQELVKTLNTNVLVTEGAEGMSLFTKKEITHKEVLAGSTAIDVSGAGDTVVAAMTLGIASGITLAESMHLATVAAGIVVGKSGTASVTAAELLESLTTSLAIPNKICTIDDLLPNKRIGKLSAVSGSFDVMHHGHLSYLREARSYGDKLVVFLNTDTSISIYKGPGRPVLSEEYRAKFLSQLSFVDYIVMMNELNPLTLLEHIKPEFFCNGSDWGENALERSTVEGYGGKFVIVSSQTRSEISTSAMVTKLVQLEKTTSEKFVFLDRDGVLIKDNGYVHQVKDVKLEDNVIKALTQLRDAGWKFIVITNQSGVGRGMFPQSDVKKVHAHISAELKKHNIRLENYFYCPHHPDKNCRCRKPDTLLLEKAAVKYGIPLSKCWMIGDKLSDVETGRRANMKTILITPKKIVITNTLHLPTHQAVNLEGAARYILSKK